ncbi:hypothetical protein CFP66_44980 [Pseudonocardia sp. MH-G8]|nr:hypothetical protein [Pseudonocardia sp. MH-G8]OZM75716.1 hypothetical protein CFP66_44980 [Pseudonocardia sp. MH-G8]
MIIDCDGCAVRGSACGDCVIGVLLGPPAGSETKSTDEPGLPEAPSGAPIVQLDAPERRALAVLADQGLVPRLRLVAPRTRRTPPDAGEAGTVRDAG